MTTPRDRALGAFSGLAVGDALGMPTQSMSRARIARRYGVVDRLLPGAPDQPIAPGLPAGSITDDTEQAVLLGRLLVTGRGQVDPRVFADALAEWEREMVARGSADLLGPSTKRAIEAILAGADPLEAGIHGTTNGAAMRITPVGIAFRPPLLLDAVVEASQVTHHTGLGIAAAAAVAAAVSSGIEGASLRDSLDLAEKTAAEGARRGRWVAGGSIAGRLRWARQWVRALPADDVPDAVADVIGTSVASQESVVAALVLAEHYAHDPLLALTTAAALGGDTDTVAAMAGAVLGAHHGLSAFPQAMLETIRSVNDLDLAPLVTDLLALR